MELSSVVLSWKDGVPFSEEYGDVYYSAEDGLEESRYVFVQGNHLPQRLASGVSSLTVAETGFGTGLNFLALWQQWRQTPEPRPRLHYITTELHPISVEALAQAHAKWPELAALSAELQSIYPPAFAGAQRRWLEGGRIQIDFLWGDAAESLAKYQPAELPAKVDAWFLDGFAPAKNAGMWHEPLYQAMARLSHATTTLASFTAAGHVRRGLDAAGFITARQKGFGRKRDMTVGRFNPSAAAITRHREAVVIGAGIAGVAAAWRMAKQGVEVTLLEAGETICAEASGNPAGAFTPYFSAKPTYRQEVLVSGFYTTRHVLDYLRAQGHAIAGQVDGTLILDADGLEGRIERLRQRQEALQLPPEVCRKVSAQQATELAGVPLAHGGWFYPQGGWIQMRDLAEALLADAGESVTLLTGKKVAEISHAQGQWCATTAAGEIFTAPQLVLANAIAAREFLPELQIEPLHGQLLQFAAPEDWRSQQRVIHAGHTLIHDGQGQIFWGASFKHGLDTPLMLPEMTELLLDDLHQALPELRAALDETTIRPWAGLRCTHRSRLPLIGQVKNQPEGLSLHLAHAARGLLAGLYPFTTM